MKFLMIMSSTALLVFIGVFVAVEARGYSSQSSYPRQYKNKAQYGGYNSGSGYGNSDSYAPSSSYSSNNYGPYHSYAVKPALYGGYSLYTYRGYARHPIYKPVRPSNSYKKNNQYRQMRQVKALALAPAYPPSYSSYPPPVYSSYSAPSSYRASSYRAPSYRAPSYGPPSYEAPSYSPPSYKRPASSYEYPRQSYKQSSKRYRNQENRSYGASAPYSDGAY